MKSGYSATQNSQYSLLDCSASPLPESTKHDFESDQDIIWCPGCGNYSILTQIQHILPELGVPRENFVFVSGTGCSGRFPYYIDTYGFHTIHGRAPAIATGVKIAHPELSVWVITGDGDALAIGGNHFIHLMRRNLDINVLLFNNRIYGLTKGQCSPTSERGKVTKSTPMGSLEKPLNPISLALATGATFVARTLDQDPEHLQNIIEAAFQHKGTAFVEICQNCCTFNNHEFSQYTAEGTRLEHTVFLKHRKPLVFGNHRDKGIRLNGLRTEVVSLIAGRFSMADLMIHDQFSEDPTHAQILARMVETSGLPYPIGIFRSVEYPCYEELMNQQINDAKLQMIGVDLPVFREAL